MSYNFQFGNKFWRSTHDKVPPLNVGDQLVINGKPHEVSSVTNNFLFLSKGSYRVLRFCNYAWDGYPVFELNGMNPFEMLEVPSAKYCLERFVTVYGKNAEREVVVTRQNWYSEL